MPRSYLLLLPLALLIACKQAEPEFSLTPPTQSGANTLSCLVDEQVFLAYGRRCTDFGSTCEEGLSVHYGPKRGRLTIDAVFSTTKHDERLSISCDSVFAPGIVGKQRPFSYRLAGLGYSNGNQNYSTADPSRTRITITRLDTITHIVSGTFEGHLKSLLLNPTTEKPAVFVTDGRFDVMYSN